MHGARQWLGRRQCHPLRGDGGEQSPTTSRIVVTILGVVSVFLCQSEYDKRLKAKIAREVSILEEVLSLVDAPFELVLIDKLA